MEIDNHPIQQSRPVLPWAVVFLAGVLALQLAHLHPMQASDQGRSAPERGGAFRAQ
jgi:uncharacterized membrane protein